MATAAYAPQVQVHVGDTVEMEFERIGVLRNRIVE
jgi:2-keto-4-pentenoate hydratase/2-oxohepta-3-ene-1,7-dioic acid hydratase in catechol pathway